MKMKLSAVALSAACGLLFASPLLAAAPQPGTTNDFLGRAAGPTFHSAEQAFSSKAYLPPPPMAGQPAFELDKAAYQAGYAQKGSPRWQQATTDADLHTANIARIFSQPLGVTISPAATPQLYHMLGDLLVDSADYATQTAKEYYMRTRPFVYFKHHTCQPPAEEAALRKNGSYPSGHTAYGWVVALTLSGLRPDRANELLERGYEFGQSRVICGAHWQSDVNAGFVVGGAEYARLQSLESFRSALQQAQQEVSQQLK